MKLLIDDNIISTKVALLEDKKIFDFNYNFKDGKNIIGNIYLGRVVNVIPSMKAIFVNIGLSKNAYLDYNDIEGEIDFNDINKSYYNGKEILVQVKKNSIDDKGAKVTEDISIPNNNLVLLPNDNKLYISRKIKNSKIKYELRKNLEELRDGLGVIARTSSAEAKLEEILSELKILKDIWKEIKRKIVIKSKYKLLYHANIDYKKLIMNYHDRIETIEVNSREIYENLIKDNRYDFKINFKENICLINYLNEIYENKVDLGNGVNLRIEETEALTVIDVNSGKFISPKNLNGIYKVNELSLKEIARQINIRSISGIIIIDLINFENKALAKKLINNFKEELFKYKNKVHVLGFTKSGLLEMTKQYTNKSVFNLITNECNSCHNGRDKNNKYEADIVVSKLKNIILETNSKRLEIRGNASLINYLNKNIKFNDFLVENDIEIVYNEQCRLEIKHLPFN